MSLMHVLGLWSVVGVIILSFFLLRAALRWFGVVKWFDSLSYEEASRIFYGVLLLSIFVALSLLLLWVD